MARRKNPKRIACRFCGLTVDVKNYDDRSAFTHGHPSRCEYRQDHVPMLNGVRVGDLWAGRHARRDDGFVEHIYRIVDIRLGGCGTYTDREPVVVTAQIWDRPEEGELGDAADVPPLAELERLPVAEDAWVWERPLWSLVETMEPLTRPGEYPVPWEMRDIHGRGHLWASAADEFRCPGIRGSTYSGDKDAAYWHAWHRIDPECQHASSNWEWWQTDPDDVTLTLNGVEFKAATVRVENNVELPAAPVAPRVKQESLF